MQEVPAARAPAGPVGAEQAGCLAAAPTQGCPGGAAVGWGFPEPLCQAGPCLHGGSQPCAPQPGRCLPAGAERRGTARATPHLPAPAETQLGAARPRCCSRWSGLPSLATSPLLPTPPFPLPALHGEPSFCVAEPTPQRPSGSPLPACTAARMGVHPGHRDCPQANAAHFRKPRSPRRRGHPTLEPCGILLTRGWRPREEEDGETTARRMGNTSH